jgi:hypothetical protein
MLRLLSFDTDVCIGVASCDDAGNICGCITVTTGMACEPTICCCPYM